MPPRPHPLPPSSFRRRLAKGLVLLGMVLLPVGLMLWMALSDLPPPEVGDLRLERVRVDDPEANAWTHFSSAGKLLAKDWKKMVYPVPGNTDPENERIIRDLLARNAEALSALHKGLACEMCVGADDSQYNATAEFSKYRLKKLLDFDIYVCWRGGDRGKAIAPIGRLARFGTLLAHQPLSMDQWILGDLSCLRAARWAHVIASDPGVTEQDLLALDRMLGGMAPSPAGLVRACKAEYLVLDNAVAEWEAAGFTRRPAVPEEGWQAWLPNHLFFQPNRTRAEAAKEARAVIASVGSYSADIPELGHDSGVFSRWKWFPKGNAAGMELIQNAHSLCPVCYHPVRIYNETRAWIGGARLVIALRLCELRRGRLPASLDELVPEFMALVPRDPHDGKPFRYVPAKRLVYGVGSDGVDDGGIKRMGSGSSKMPTSWPATLDDVLEIGPPLGK